jgi:geranylgeranyl diphosphate synthase type II
LKTVENTTQPPTHDGNVENYLRACRTEVERALNGWLPTAPDSPALAVEAMRYSLFAGGKRLRPSLTLAAADTVAGPATPDKRALVLPAACAIEMIHTYSLIHDDLPAMDDDTLRRGRPTAHVVYGEGMAILAGDALLTEAFRVVTRWPQTDDPTVVGRKLRVAERTALAAGAVGMVGGQVIDLHAAGQISTPSASTLSDARPLTAEELRRMHERKTGALIRAAAVAGAIMVGASDTETHAVDAYARDLGLSFQIIDDVLDVEGAADQLGKTAGKDAAAGKPTYPSMFGLEESRHMAARSIQQARAHLDAASLAGPLIPIAEWVLARTH